MLKEGQGPSEPTVSTTRRRQSGFGCGLLFPGLFWTFIWPTLPLPAHHPTLWCLYKGKLLAGRRNHGEKPGGDRPAAGASLTSPPCLWASHGHPGRSSIRTSCRPKRISPCCTWWLLPTPVTLALTAAGRWRPRSLQHKERWARFIHLCSSWHLIYCLFILPERRPWARDRCPPNMQLLILVNKSP